MTGERTPPSAHPVGRRTAPGGRSTERWKWLCLAAHRNHANAQAAFAKAYAGEGGEPLAANADQDLVQAYLWYSLAASSGSLDANRSRRDLTEKMGPEEVAEAERRVSAWKPDPASCDGLFSQ